MDFYCQYKKNGYCKETEKPSGRIQGCPCVFGGTCLMGGKIIKGEIRWDDDDKELVA